jgi:hypothetical protein
MEHEGKRMGDVGGKSSISAPIPGDGKLEPRLAGQQQDKRVVREAYEEIILCLNMDLSIMFGSGPATRSCVLGSAELQAVRF